MKRLFRVLFLSAALSAAGGIIGLYGLKLLTASRRLGTPTLLLTCVLAIALVSGTQATSGGERSCYGEPATITRGNGNNTIVGTSGPDVIIAGGGNDVVRGRGGRDRICGDTGQDTLRGGGNDDDVSGGPGKDELRGGAGDNRLSGQEGDDYIRGGDGDDRFNGGEDSDGGDEDVCDLSGGGNDRLKNCEFSGRSVS